MYIGEEPSAKIPTGNDSGESQSNTSASASPLVISRKHTRSPSPVAKSPSVTPTSTTDTTTTTTQPAPATPPADNTKPVQTNKGRCFKCRVKVDRSLFISIYSPDVLSYNAPSRCHWQSRPSTNAGASMSFAILIVIPTDTTAMSILLNLIEVCPLQKRIFEYNDTNHFFCTNRYIGQE